MGPIQGIRPAVPVMGPLPPPTTGPAASAGSSALNGGRAAPVAPQTPRPVAPAVGAASGQMAEENHAIETARARAEAAQRAYAMASLMAGVNPLSDPVP